MTTTAQAPALPASDDLAAELIRRRRRRLPVLTAILALVVMLGAGIVGGVEIQKHRATPATSGAAAGRAAFAGRFAGGAAGGAAGGRFGGFGGGAAGGGGTTSGTVTLIKGTTLYVTDASGNTVQVTTKPTSQVTKTVAGTLQSVHPGDTVTVTGTQASNGSYAATGISIGSGASNG